MTSEEERLKRRKKIRRDEIARDLHSPKYRQRQLPSKRKGGKYDGQTVEDLRDIHRTMSHDVVDDFDMD